MADRVKVVNRNISQILYLFSTQKGIPVVLFHRTEGVFDPITGENTSVDVEYKIRRAITWSVEEQMITTRLSRLAGQDFADFEIGDRHLLIQKRFMPLVTWTTAGDFYFKVNSNLYQIVRMNVFDGNVAIYFLLRKVSDIRLPLSATLIDVILTKDEYTS